MKDFEKEAYALGLKLEATSGYGPQGLDMGGQRAEVIKSFLRRAYAEGMEEAAKICESIEGHHNISCNMEYEDAENEVAQEFAVRADEAKDIAEAIRTAAQAIEEEK